MTSETWGDFEVFVDRIVGRGGTSVVYEARQISLDRPCVVKVLDAPNPELREELLARFRNEARLIARVRDPRIIPVYQSGEHQGRLWLAMEKADGGTLESLISEGELLPEAEVMRIGREIARGLQSVYEQERIIHRDIKPSNIFLTRTKEIRIADFGLAKVVTGKATKLTDTGTVMGTPAYLAPEVIRGDEVDYRADIYALGCLLYEMLVQLPPFDGDSFVDVMYKHVNQMPTSPRELRPQVSPRLNEMVMRCLCKRKEDRFPNYGELIAALEPEAIPLPAAPRKPLLKLALGLAAAALIVGASVIVALYSSRLDWTPEPRPMETVRVDPPRPIEPKAPPSFDDRLEELRLTFSSDPRRSIDLADQLLKDVPDRKDVADLLLRAKISCWQIKEPIGDSRFDPVLKHLASIEKLEPFRSVGDLEKYVQCSDDLQAWAADEKRDPVARSLGLHLSASYLDRVGALDEAGEARERARNIFPCVVPRFGWGTKGLYDELLESVNVASRKGDLEPARRARSIAQRFRLTPITEGMKDVERELHAAELLETGNDADVLQNYPGTRAYGEVTTKVRNDWRRWKRKNWIAMPDSWTKRGPQLAQSKFDFSDGGLSIQTTSPAYAECSLANAEQGLAVEFEGQFDDSGWASIVLHPDAPVYVSIFKDRIEVQSGKTMRVQKKAKGLICLDVIPYRDHVMIYLQGECLTVFAPGEMELDSIVRIGACNGTVAIRKVEVPE